MNKLRNSFYTLYFSFGIYGFSRGFRSNYDYNSFTKGSGNKEYEYNSNRFFTEKLFLGTLNAIIYVTPPYNIYYLAKLLNRLEIQRKSLNKSDYKDQYIELFGGKCDSTW